MTRRTTSILFAAVLTSLAVPVSAQSANAVAGEKLDSGLGSLPHYSKWATPAAGKAAAVRVEGESLDNQLGELPHYRFWADRTGKDPMGTQTAAAMRYASAKSAAKAVVKPSERIVQASN
jgi:hypothetical protein